MQHVFSCLPYVTMAGRGKYVRLTVCLFVCGWVCKVDDTGRTVQAINTKLGTYMYL